MTKASLLLSALLLGACGGETAADNNAADANLAVEAPAAPANEAAPAPAAPADGSFSAAYMVGKWSAINEDCADTLDFKEGGVVTTPIGDAKYSVAGDKLTIDYGEGSTPTTTTIKVLTPDRIEITRASGGSETQKRCP